MDIEQVQPGMKLAEDVHNLTGMVLCRAGTVLTENLIERLKTAGIGKISIEETILPEKAKKLFEEKKILLDKAFNKKNNSMQIIKEVFLRFWEQKYFGS